MSESRGYIISALGDAYWSCAERLAHSLKTWHPDVSVAAMTLEDKHSDVFDHVFTLPLGDKRRNEHASHQENDWQLARVSPWHETIKLEADMLITGPVDHWWQIFRNRDLVISTGCRDYYGVLSDNRAYRRLFDDNNLPDVYNAITYWRQSETAQQFWKLVRQIFSRWNDYRRLLKFSDNEPTTDVVYAMAAQIMGPDSVTLPAGLSPQITHMKRRVIGTRTDDWTRELVWENDQGVIRINTVAQSGCLHYHVKDWCHRV
jgi:hypothetical protein